MVPQILDQLVHDAYLYLQTLPIGDRNVIDNLRRQIAEGQRSMFISMQVRQFVTAVPRIAPLFRQYLEELDQINAALMLEREAVERGMIRVQNIETSNENIVVNISDNPAAEPPNQPPTPRQPTPQDQPPNPNDRPHINTPNNTFDAENVGIQLMYNGQTFGRVFGLDPDNHGNGFTRIQKIYVRGIDHNNHFRIGTIKFNWLKDAHDKDPKLDKFYTCKHIPVDDGIESTEKWHIITDCCFQYKWSPLPQPRSVSWIITCCGVTMPEQQKPAMYNTFVNMPLLDVYRIGFTQYTMLKVFSSTVLFNYSATGTCLENWCSNRNLQRFGNSIGTIVFPVSSASPDANALFFYHVHQLAQSCTSNGFYIKYWRRSWNNDELYPDVHDVADNSHGVYVRNWPNRIPRDGSVLAIDFLLTLRPIEWGLSDAPPKLTNVPAIIENIGHNQFPKRVRPHLDFTDMYSARAGSYIGYQFVPGVLNVINTLFMTAHRQPNGRPAFVFAVASDGLPNPTINWTLRDNLADFNPIIDDELFIIEPLTLISYNWMSNLIMSLCFVYNSHNTWIPAVTAHGTRSTEISRCAYIICNDRANITHGFIFTEVSKDLPAGMIMPSSDPALSIDWTSKGHSASCTDSNCRGGCIIDIKTRDNIAVGAATNVQAFATGASTVIIQNEVAQSGAAAIDDKSSTAQDGKSKKGDESNKQVNDDKDGKNDKTNKPKSSKKKRSKNKNQKKDDSKKNNKSDDDDAAEAEYKNAKRKKSKQKSRENPKKQKKEDKNAKRAPNDSKEADDDDDSSSSSSESNADDDQSN